MTSQSIEIWDIQYLFQELEYAYEIHYGGIQPNQWKQYLWYFYFEDLEDWNLDELPNNFRLHGFSFPSIQAFHNIVFWRIQNEIEQMEEDEEPIDWNDVKHFIPLNIHVPNGEPQKLINLISHIL